jgi:hypothetical protein
MWSDRDTEHDCLGFTSYVDVLADVCTLPDLAPLTLGIFGSWGSGKTSLMHMLQRRIDGLGSGVKTLWFNAWRYEGREEAHSALIHAILARLSEDATLLQDAHGALGRLMKGASVLKLAKFITKTAVTLTPDLQGFIDCFQEESKQIAETMEQFDKDFAEFLQRMKVKHVVVFIDDLDRCSSSKVIETFETIKLFLNTPSCTFVIGADAAKIEDAVGEVYGVSEHRRRKDYLEKIIQVPFTIPAQDLRDITCYVGMLVLARHIHAEKAKELLDARPGFFESNDGVSVAVRQWPADNSILFKNNLGLIQEDLDHILPHISVLAGGLQGNPRQIKRFLNIVQLRHRLAKANRLEIDPALLIKVAVLEYVWDDFFTAIVETVDPTTGRSELIGDMLRAADKEQESESQLVSESLRRGGLLEFLQAAPRLTGDVDLNAYLFLAQTSLSRGRRDALVPVEEKAKSLARLIESEDPLRTKTAARQAAAQDVAVATAVVRALLADLPGGSMTAQTHTLSGLAVVCQAHPDLYTPVLKFLGQFNPPPRAAVAIAASTLLAAAERAGRDVPTELKEKFTSQSKIAAALAPPKKRGNSPSSKR